MNRAQKGWQTRYVNEIAIIDNQLETLKDELYSQFLTFINKTAKYQDLTRQRDGMQKELERFQARTKGGLSSE